MNIKNPYDCEHENNEIRRRIVGGGAEQYIRQCLDCGKTVGTAVKKAVVFEKYPNGVDDYDDALVRLKEHQYDMYMEQQQQERRREFFDWYSEYLKSTEWRNRRARFLNELETSARDACRQMQPKSTISPMTMLGMNYCSSLLLCAARATQKHTRARSDIAELILEINRVFGKPEEVKYERN